MRRVAILALMVAGLLLGCSRGISKYNPPPKTYPTLFTFNYDLDLVWDATLKALAGLEFEVVKADKASGRIETKWTDTGVAPPRHCKYGFMNYVENPLRREKLSIVVKPGPAVAPPAAPGRYPGAPAAPGGYPGAAPGYPGAAPGYPGAPAAPPAAPGYPGFPGSPGDVGSMVLAQAFPPPMGGHMAPPAAPMGGGNRTMVIVVSKGQSILAEECGGQPKVVDLSSDTSTEYRVLYTIGQKLGQRMEAPAY